MSTENGSPPRRRRWLRHGLVLLVAFPTVAGAAQWRFLPSLDLGFYRDGNVGGTGSGGSSDEVVRVGVDFEFEWDTQVTKTRLSYNPYREFYNEFNDLDYTAHNLSLDIAHEVSRRSSFNLDLGGILTERQPVRSDRPDTTVTLLPRGKQISGYLDVNGRVGAGKRSFFDWEASANRTEFPDDTAGTQSDTDSYGVGLGWGVELGPSTDIGARVRGERLGFEDQDSTELLALEMFFDHDFSRAFKASFSAGAQRAITGGLDAINPKYKATLTETFRSGAELEGGIRQEVTSAAGASSATLDRGGYISLRPKDRAEHWSSQVTAYYWTRAEAISSGPNIDIQTFEALGSLSWSPRSGHFALGGFYSYHDQNDASGAGPSVDTSYSSGGFYFRWNFQGVRGVGS